MSRLAEFVAFLLLVFMRTGATEALLEFVFSRLFVVILFMVSVGTEATEEPLEFVLSRLVVFVAFLLMVVLHDVASVAARPCGLGLEAPVSRNGPREHARFGLRGLRIGEAFNPGPARLAVTRANGEAATLSLVKSGHPESQDINSI